MTTTDNIKDLERLTDAAEATGRDIAPLYNEYIKMAFGIAEDCGEAGRECFHRLCRLHKDYKHDATERVFNNALKTKRGETHLGTVFYLAQKAGVEVMRARNEWKAEKQRGTGEGNKTWRVTETAGRDEEDAPAADPSSPLPVFRRYDWPAPLTDILAIAQRDSLADAMLIGAFTVIGATISSHVRTLYGRKWYYPSLQTFIIAPAASGKGTLAFLRAFGQRRHNALREQYDREMAEYMLKIRAMKSKDDGENTDLPQRPLNRMFFIAGNNTGTGILQNIIDNDGEGLIFEPEADTVSSAIKGDYGHWSDTLRKAFDHDPLSFNRRTNNEYRETDCTRLGVLLSGTPQQLAKLIPSAENGLFSRQLFYYISSVQQWADQFSENNTDTRLLFERMGKKWGDTAELLRTSNFTLVLDKEQKNDFNELFDYLFRRTTASTGGEMNSFVLRLAVNILRIMAVTALLRAAEGHSLFITDNNCLFSTRVHMSSLNPGTYLVTLTAQDFNAVLSLAEPLAAHATHALSLLPHTVVQRRQLSDREQLLAQMPQHFTRKMFIDKARERGMDTAQLDVWLKRLAKKGIVEKGANWGEYIKKQLYKPKSTQGAQPLAPQDNALPTQHVIPDNTTPAMTTPDTHAQERQESTKSSSTPPLPAYLDTRDEPPF